MENEISISDELAAAGITHKRDECSLGPYGHSLYDADGNFLGSYMALEAVRALRDGRLKPRVPISKGSK